jgi:DNA adenine methylase/adenine-specific DNA-methyltransferase
VSAAPGRERDGLPERVARYPALRFMGSKQRLLPWLHEALAGLEFDTALDAFSGSAAVSYLLKAMGKQVTANDFLEFTALIAAAVIQNSRERLAPGDVERILQGDEARADFIEQNFTGIFYAPEDLRFLDRAWWNIQALPSDHKRALALAALLRSCVKRQPRGVFTVAGDPERYKDGRRDLQLSLREHFVEQVQVYNASVFDNGRPQRAQRGDVFAVDPRGFDLVYLDPPYVPRADDNCYMKRYHFLEGLSRYWSGVEILERSKVRKIRKPHTPFSYRREALAAFDRLFEKFQASIVVLSYSSNGYPDLPSLLALLRRYKRDVRVRERGHRYHFGTHRAVSAERSRVREYLLIGR